MLGTGLGWLVANWNCWLNCASVRGVAPKYEYAEKSGANMVRIYKKGPPETERA